METVNNSCERTVQLV